MDLSRFNLDDDVKAKLEAAISDEVKGLKDKNAELLGKQKDLKTAIDAANDKLKSFDGLDIGGLKKMAEQAQTSKEAEMLKAGQFQELMQLKLNEQQSTFQAQIDAIKGEADKYKTEFEQTQNKYSETQLENAIRSAAASVKDLH